MRYAILVSLLAVLPHSVLAAKGANAITFTFDDLPGDAIQSDGLGSYPGAVKKYDGSFAMKGSLFFDFSMPVIVEGLQPFGPGEDSGIIDDVSLRVYHSGGSSAQAIFEFIAPAPDGSGPTEWWLMFNMEMAEVAPGVYVLGNPEIGVLNWRTDPVREHTPGPKRGPGYQDDGWRFAGYFVMPWGAVVEL